MTREIGNCRGDAPSPNGKLCTFWLREAGMQSGGGGHMLLRRGRIYLAWPPKLLKHYTTPSVLHVFFFSLLFPQ